jgi:hypothetical protein
MRRVRPLAALAALTLSGAPALACPLPGEGFHRRAVADAEIAYRWDPNHYRFTGLMLHMPGKWMITFPVGHGTSGPLLTRLLHEVNVER